MTSKCKKSLIWLFRPWKMTFRAIQPNISFDMWFMSPKRSFMPKKKKSYWSVSEIDPSPPQSWRTDGQTDGQTDGRTDRRTTDKSVLEKLRCLSAGGAKNVTYNLAPIVENVVPLKHILICGTPKAYKAWIMGCTHAHTHTCTGEQPIPLAQCIAVGANKHTIFHAMSCNDITTVKFTVHWLLAWTGLEIKGSITSKY